MPYCPELNVLAFVIEEDRVLMVHRIAREGDEQFGKWNGLGGKVEPGEGPLAAIRRELREEANIEVESIRLRGTVDWPGFHADGSAVFGFIYVVDAYRGQIPEANEEGPLFWKGIDELPALDMYEGDRFFLPLVFDDQVTQFHLVIPYCDGAPTGCHGDIETLEDGELAWQRVDVELHDPDLDAR